MWTCRWKWRSWSWCWWPTHRKDRPLLPPAPWRTQRAAATLRSETSLTSATWRPCRRWLWSTASFVCWLIIGDVSLIITCTGPHWPRGLSWTFKVWSKNKQLLFIIIYYYLIGLWVWVIHSIYSFIKFDYIHLIKWN